MAVKESPKPVELGYDARMMIEKQVAEIAAAAGVAIHSIVLCAAARIEKEISTAQIKK